MNASPVPSQVNSSESHFWRPLRKSAAPGICSSGQHDKASWYSSGYLVHCSCSLGSLTRQSTCTYVFASGGIQGPHPWKEVKEDFLEEITPEINLKAWISQKVRQVKRRTWGGHSGQKKQHTHRSGGLNVFPNCKEPGMTEIHLQHSLRDGEFKMPGEVSNDWLLKRCWPQPTTTATLFCDSPLVAVNSK